MINRLLIRIKVLQVLYNYYRVEGMGIPGAIKLLGYALEQSYNLYLYLTGLPYDLKILAIERLSKEEEKFTINDKVISLLKHIINNPLTDIISQDKEYLEARDEAFTTTHDIDDFMKKVLQTLLDNSETYLNIQWDSLADIKKAWRAFYGQEIVKSDTFNSFLEATDTFRNDDIDIVFTFATKVYNGINDDKPFSQQLRKPYTSEEDEAFGPTLLEQAIIHRSEYCDWISKYFKNWDKDRVSEMDYLIMLLAVCEAIHFPMTDTRVILNEYISLSHYYSSQISHTFINGILHELLQNLKPRARS